MTNPNPNVYESFSISPKLLKNIDFKHGFCLGLNQHLTLFGWIMDLLWRHCSEI